MSPYEQVSDHSDRRYRKTDRAIRDAFYKLASEMEVEKIRVTAIAKEADIDRKTFYVHYESVEALIDQIARESASRIVSILRSSDIFNKKTTLIQELSAQIGLDDNVLTGIAQHISIQRVIELIEKPLIDAMLEDDTYGFGKEKPFEICLVTFVVSGLLGMYKAWIGQDSEVPLDELVRAENFAVQSLITAFERE